MTSKEYDPTSNNLSFSEPFKYPKDNDDNQDNDALIKQGICEFLIKLSNYLVPAPNPRLTLIALMFASNIDLSYLLRCKNSETEIAAKLGISKQSFSTILKQVRTDFNLVHSTTINHSVNKTTYVNNSKKIKE